MGRLLVRYLGKLRGSLTAKLVPWGELGKLQDILVELNELV